MKTTKLLLLFFAFLCLAATNGNAETLVLYTFTDSVATPETTQPFVAATPVTLSAGTVILGTTGPGDWTGSGVPYAQGNGGWASGTQAAAKHFRFTLNELNGVTFTPTNVALRFRSTPAGPSAMGISINGTSVHSQTNAANATILLSVPISGFVDLTQAVVRIEGFQDPNRTTSGGGQFRIDDVLVQGTVDQPGAEFPPTLSTPTATDIVGTTAILGGTITDTGDSPVTERGIYWSTVSGFDPETEGIKASESGTFDTGAYALNVGGLSAQTTVYFVAFARNLAGQGFSEEGSLLSGDPDLPIITTPARIGGSPTSLELEAVIISTGGVSVVERGFYYSEFQGFDPQFEGTKISEVGAFGTGEYSFDIAGLDQNTEYYVRAFARNSVGTGFSSENSFQTPAIPPPGALALYTFSGESAAPDVTDLEVTATTFAVSAGSLAYGNAQSAEWSAAGASVPYAESGGGWTAGSQSAAKHFLVQLTASAGNVMTITNINLIHRRTGTGPEDTGISINGVSVHAQTLSAGSTEFLSVPITGFVDMANASIRIQGWNGGSGDYRVDNVFIEGFVDAANALIPPTVTDPTATNLVGITATLGGSISDAGDALITERGVYWSTFSGFDPESEGEKVSEIGVFAVGDFTVEVDSLEPDSTIYYVAFARNSAGPGYSDEDSFSSGSIPLDPPTVTTPGASNIRENSAWLGGTIEDDGGGTILRRGIVWSDQAGFDPEQGSAVEETGAYALGPFSLLTEGLPAGTRVYFRAFAENAQSVGYSGQALFYTTPTNALTFFPFTGNTSTPQTVTGGLTCTDMSMTVGTIGYGTANAATWTGSGIVYARSSGGWNSTNRNTAKSYRFTVEAESGWGFSITNVTLRYRSAGSGPSALGIAINGDNLHEEDTPDSVTTEVSIVVTNFNDLGMAEIHIQGWDNASRSTPGTGEFQIDDVLVQGFATFDGNIPSGPEPIVDFTRTGGQVNVTIVSVVGVDYALEYTLDLTEEPQPTWTVVDSAVGTGEEIPLIDSERLEPMRIYRVVPQP